MSEQPIQGEEKYDCVYALRQYFMVTMKQKPIASRFRGGILPGLKNVAKKKDCLTGEAESECRHE